ncbi:hypothetical protein ACSSS7_005439 [Eimeria intestinalis]
MINGRNRKGRKRRKRLPPSRQQHLKRYARCGRTNPTSGFITNLQQQQQQQQLPLPMFAAAEPAVADVADVAVARSNSVLGPHRETLAQPRNDSGMSIWCKDRGLSLTKEFLFSLSVLCPAATPNVVEGDLFAS